MRLHRPGTGLHPTRPLGNASARLRLAGLALVCAVAAGADAGPRVRLREIAVPEGSGLSVVSGAGDGSAYLTGPVQTPTRFAWRRVRASPDGQETVTDVPDDRTHPFNWFVTGDTGTTAYISPSQIVLVGADGGTTQLPGGLGFAQEGAMRGGVLHLTEFRPGPQGSSVWGAEVFRPDGTRTDVPDMGLFAQWVAPVVGPAAPGVGGVRSVSSYPISGQVDSLGRMHTTFLVRTHFADGTDASEIAIRSVNTDGTSAHVTPPTLPPLAETPGFAPTRGMFRVADDGSAWLVRTLNTSESGDEFTDVAVRMPDGTTATSAQHRRTRGFPGRFRFQGDVAANGRFVAVSSDVLATGSQRTLQLVWRRFDGPAENGSMRTQRRVLLKRLATSRDGGGRSGFEARAYDVAVAPDGTCLVAFVSSAGPRAPRRLRLLVVSPAGRTVFRDTRRVAGDVALDVAACGDHGFIVLPTPDSGGDMTAIHLVR